MNGSLVGRGPARGDVHHHFYESYDLGQRLRTGRNVLAALVLDMSKVANWPSALGAPCAIMTHSGGFLLEGEVQEPGGSATPLDTGLPGWKVAVDTAFRFQNDGTRFEGYHGYFEHRIGAEQPAGWTELDFDDSSWEEATSLYRAERFEDRRDPASPYGLLPRIIPHLEEGDDAQFACCFAPGGGSAGAGWDALIASNQEITLSPGQSIRVVMDAGRLTTAYPRLITSGGAGAKIRLKYAEALRLQWSTPEAQMLGRPQPLANLAAHFADESSGWTFDRRGEVTGWSDIWEPAGLGREIFEPWHWREFRFVGLEISVGDSPLTMHALSHRFTTYPYEISAKFGCSDSRLEAIWRAAIHTMRLCAHETFKDGPHYEQMQYAGDTMITSRLAMLASGDYRLSRQALLHFEWSRLPEGLTQSRYPSRLLQVIPSWSLHWITCIRDYAYCSGDLETVRALLPGATAVLDWFRRHAGEDGLPARLPYWNITDWCPWWPRGVVPGADSGPTCIIASQYVNALEEAADLRRLAWPGDTAGDFAAEAARLRRAINNRFWSAAEGLYFDRPGGPEVSQYGNAWAIVCGAADETQLARIMQRFPTDARLAPGSYFCWHTIFRAFERCGAVDRLTDFLGPWHEQIDLGLDTFVEENSYWRSLCHAWSAHPAITFLTQILGVAPDARGFARISIRPHRCGLSHASGRVCTPRGPVEVDWRADRSRFSFNAATPAATPVCVVLPDGSKHEFTGGRIELECGIVA